MNISGEVIREFETGLDPGNLGNSTIPADVLGYGEISTVFRIGDDKDYAYKRMPLFSSIESAEKYTKDYRTYCKHLSQAGLHLPDDDTTIIASSGRQVVLYIIQKQLPPERFAHKLLHSLIDDEIAQMIKAITRIIKKINSFNDTHRLNLEIALDGQLSNWVLLEDGSLLYVDTSTPLFRVNGEEQLDPELFLKSAPSFLRWIIRWLFLEDVMNRYYDKRQVYIDLVANLYKEQRSDLVPLVIEIINREDSAGMEPLTEKEVKKYYSEDKLIWTLFLAFRRLDRWIKAKILRKRYELILPGKIKR